MSPSLISAALENFHWTNLSKLATHGNLCIERDLVFIVTIYVSGYCCKISEIFTSLSICKVKFDSGTKWLFFAYPARMVTVPEKMAQCSIVACFALRGTYWLNVVFPAKERSWKFQRNSRSVRGEPIYPEDASWVWDNLVPREETFRPSQPPPITTDCPFFHFAAETNGWCHKIFEGGVLSNCQQALRSHLNMHALVEVLLPAGDPPHLGAVLQQERREEVEDRLGERVPQQLLGQDQPVLVVDRLLVEILSHAANIVRAVALGKICLAICLRARVRQINLREKLCETFLRRLRQLIFLTFTALLF